MFLDQPKFPAHTLDARKKRNQDESRVAREIREFEDLYREEIEAALESDEDYDDTNIEERYADDFQLRENEQKSPGLGDLCNSICIYLQARLSPESKGARSSRAQRIHAEGIFDEILFNGGFKALSGGFDELLSDLLAQSNSDISPVEMSKIVMQRLLSEVYGKCANPEYESPTHGSLPLEKAKIVGTISPEKLLQIQSRGHVVRDFDPNEYAEQDCKDGHDDYEDFDLYDHLEWRTPPPTIRRAKPVHLSHLRAHVDIDAGSAVLPHKKEYGRRRVEVDKLKRILESRISHALSMRDTSLFTHAQDAATRLRLGRLTLPVDEGTKERFHLSTVRKISSKAYDEETKLYRALLFQRNFELVDDEVAGTTHIYHVNDEERRSEVARMVTCCKHGRVNGYALFENSDCDDTAFEGAITEIEDVQKLLSNKGILVRIAERMLRREVEVDDVLLRKLEHYAGKNGVNAKIKKKSDRLLNAITSDAEIRRLFIDHIDLFYFFEAKSAMKKRADTKRTHKANMKKWAEKFSAEERERFEKDKARSETTNIKSNVLIKQDYPITRGMPRQPTRASLEPDSNRFHNY